MRDLPTSPELEQQEADTGHYVWFGAVQKARAAQHAATRKAVLEEVKAHLELRGSAVIGHWLTTEIERAG